MREEQRKMVDELDLEKEKTYRCSDGSRISTIDVDNVAKAQRDLSYKVGF